MKLKVTKKVIRDNFGDKYIIRLRYCTLCNTLNFIDPFAYSTRAEGWACDYYDLGNGYCISSGYDAIGKVTLSDDTINEINLKTIDIGCSSKLTYKEKKEKALALLVSIIEKRGVIKRE